MNTNTLDVEVRPHGDRVRTSAMDASIQPSIPIVDVMLPSGGGYHLAIPQVNLSISKYEPDPLRNSHIRSLSMQIQEILIMLQLDGLASLPIRDPIGRRIQEDPRLVGQEYSQGGTYVQGASMPRRREYPGGNGTGDDDYRRSYRDQRPPERGRYPNQGGRPPDQGGYPDRGPPGGGYPHRDRRPPGRGGYPGGGPPDGNGEPPNGGGPLEMEDPLDPLVKKDHQIVKDPLDQ